MKQMVYENKKPTPGQLVHIMIDRPRPQPLRPGGRRRGARGGNRARGGIGADRQTAVRAFEGRAEINEKGYYHRRRGRAGDSAGQPRAGKARDGRGPGYQGERGARHVAARRRRGIASDPAFADPMGGVSQKLVRYITGA